MSKASAIPGQVITGSHARRGRLQRQAAQGHLAGRRAHRDLAGRELRGGLRARPSVTAIRPRARAVGIGRAAVACRQARSRHGDDVRIRRARRLLAADGHLRRVRRQGTFYVCAVALERNRKAARAIARPRPRRGVPRLSLGGRDAAQPRAGARAYPAGRRSRSPRRPASGRSAGIAAMDPASTRASWWSRKAASSTTPTPTTTTCPTGRRSTAPSTWSSRTPW